MYEIDALERNSGDIIMQIDQAAAISPEEVASDFHDRLDSRIEARNVSGAQVSFLGHLIETALKAGKLC